MLEAAKQVAVFLIGSTLFAIAVITCAVIVGKYTGWLLGMVINVNQ